MTNWKVGDQAFVVSTEEPTTVLGVREIREEERGKKFPAHYDGSGVVVTVRRPVMSEVNGIRYELWDFLAEEVESSTEQTARLYARIKERQKIAMSDMDLGEGTVSGGPKLVRH